ncbi:MAG TPA: OB-fold domain-containing protein [Candidatus Thermoplasmatota archaeon]|nr:OB-fold domain-containing protein [Candidatus Thermoplasmatota archaeon]
MAEAQAAAKPVMTQKEQKEAAKDGRLLAWACATCGHKSITPMYVCPQDRSRDIGVAQLPSEGVVEAYTVQKLIAPEEFLNDIPFAFCVVRLDDGTHVSGMVLDVASERDLPAGARVRHAPSYKSVFLFEKTATNDGRPPA